MTAEPAPGDAADLDAVAGGPPPPSGPAPGRRRRSRLVAALLVLVVVAALVVAQQVERARRSQVQLVAVDGALLAIGQPASSDGDTVVAVEVQLRNDGPEAVTVRSVRAGGAGRLLGDDLSGEREAVGSGRDGRVPPGAALPVVLSGVLVCPPASGPDVATGNLTVVARAADGTERTVDVAAPRGEEWRDALARACAAGPDDGRPAMA